MGRLSHIGALTPEELRGSNWRPQQLGITKVEPGWFEEEWISGVKNAWLALGAGAFLLLLVAAGGRR